MIKENFTERGVALSRLNLNDQSIDRTAREIIEGLPRDLRNARGRSVVLAKEQDTSHSLRGRATELTYLQSDERDTISRDLAHSGDESRAMSALIISRNGQAQPEESLSLEEEFVEQRVASQLDHVRPVMPHQPAPPIHDNHHHQAHAHDNTQVMEKVIQLTLSR